VSPRDRTFLEISFFQRLIQYSSPRSYHVHEKIQNFMIPIEAGKSSSAFLRFELSADSLE
jgi:hypothetical protein